MSATMAYIPKVVNLCKALKRGPLPLEKLSDDLRAEEILGSAFADGLIEVGRQEYSEVPDNVPGDGAAGKVRKGRDGKPVLDEHGRQIVDREMKTLAENTWSWLNREMKNRAPLSAVLAEKDEAAPPLHCRLTSAGLAATAQ